MASNLYQSWWKEMGAISRGMMFIQGSLTASADQNALAAPGVLATERKGEAETGDLRKKARRAYRNFLLLGGRSVTPGHNDDIDEPFPLIDDDEPAPRSWSAPAQRNKPSQSQTCATC